MKKERKRKPMEVMQPGAVNEFWETILRLRDAGDKRWHEFSRGFQVSAEAYERNRDKASTARAA